MKKIKVYIVVVESELAYSEDKIEEVKAFTSRQEMLKWAEISKDCITTINFFEDEIEI